MKATLYLPGKDKPAAVLDDVKIVQLNDNHKLAPERIFYRTRHLNADKTMVELYRHASMKLKLEDGREGHVVLQHTSLDSQGNHVGVLRVLDGLGA